MKANVLKFLVAIAIIIAINSNLASEIFANEPSAEEYKRKECQFAADYTCHGKGSDCLIAKSCSGMSD